MLTSPLTTLLRSFIVAATLSTLVASSAAQPRFPSTVARPAPASAAAVFQYSTLPALSLGLYDGGMTFGEVLRNGNFGLGTVDALDGEVIILDGKAWQVRSSGEVVQLSVRTTTPFAVVTRFAPERRLRMERAEYSDIRRILREFLPTQNLPYAFEVKGIFSRIKVRSVPRQSKPYRPLAEVVKTQTVWEWQNVKGTLVGFRFPSYLANVNLADYHFHFISDDRKRGGHLLDCFLESGDIHIQTLQKFELLLPHTESFRRADFSTDQSQSLHQAETAR